MGKQDGSLLSGVLGYGQNYIIRPGEMAQELTALAALLEVPSPIPSTHLLLTTFCNSGSRESNSLFWPLGHCIHVVHRHMQVKHSYTVSKNLKRGWVGSHTRRQVCLALLSRVLKVLP